MEPLFLASLWGLISVGALLLPAANCEMEPPGHKRGSPLLERRRGVARSL
jgi:hypothetical protein